MSEEIENHVFQDPDFEEVTLDNQGAVDIWFEQLVTHFLIYKNDAIALAKHFELTAEDISNG